MVEVRISQADRHTATVFVGTTVPLVALVTTTIITRFVRKFRSSLRFRWEDHLLMAGFILAIAEWIMFSITLAYFIPPSRQVVSKTDLVPVNMLKVLAIPVWSLSIVCIKVGVAIQLLRFTDNRISKMILYVLIGIIVPTSLALALTDLLQCIPIAALWDTTIVGAKCFGGHKFRLGWIVYSGFNVISDIILSLFPLTFIYRIQRPRTEKVLISVLMGMGMTASAASILKTYIMVKCHRSIVEVPCASVLSFWTSMEMFIGIFAACLPSLKPMFQTWLVAMGINFTSGDTTYLPDSYVVRHVTMESVGRTVDVPKDNLAFSANVTESLATSTTLRSSSSKSESNDESEESLDRERARAVSLSHV